MNAARPKKNLLRTKGNQRVARNKLYPSYSDNRTDTRYDARNMILLSYEIINHNLSQKTNHNARHNSTQTSWEQS